jgi:hypothetical protein
MLFLPCDQWLNESRGLPGHVNCRDNFLAAVASAGISLPGGASEIRSDRKTPSRWPVPAGNCRDAYLPALAMSLNNHALRLAETGRRAEVTSHTPR